MSKLIMRILLIFIFPVMLLSSTQSGHSQNASGEFTFGGPASEFSNMFILEEPSLRKVKSMLNRHPELKQAGDATFGALFDRPIDGALANCIGATIKPCDIKIVEYLIESGADVNAKGKHTSQAILSKYINDTSFGYNAQTQNDWNPASFANYGETVRANGREERIKRLKLLLDNGADIPDYDAASGNPTLVTAAWIGQDFVQLLIEAGANPEPAVAYFEREVAEFKQMREAISNIAPVE